MPWHLEKNDGGEWCVHKGHSGTKGEKVACHPSREAAIKHMRALYKNVPDAAALADPAATETVDVVELGGELRTVVVADTAAARARGLGGVPELTTDGMLFAYEEDVFVPFTGKPLLFPVLVAFYDRDGKFVSAQRLQPGSDDPAWPDTTFRFALETTEEQFVPGALRRL